MYYYYYYYKQFLAVIDWVSKIWQNLDSSLIKESFDYCGITSCRVESFHSVLKHMLTQQTIIREFVTDIDASDDCDEFQTDNLSDLENEVNDSSDSSIDYPTSFQSSPSPQSATSNSQSSASIEQSTSFQSSPSPQSAKSNSQSSASIEQSTSLQSSSSPQSATSNSHPINAVEIVKRKRGRPKGSKNKKTVNKQ
jgi:hypothetical protein